MGVIEHMRMAVSSVLINKMRSILTIIGIVIGIASVITVVAIGNGGEAVLKGLIVGSGNTIEVFYNASKEDGESAHLDNEGYFTQQDAKALKEIQGIKNVVVSSSIFSSARFHEDTIDSSIRGINEAYFDVNELVVNKGRKFVESDFITSRSVGIINNKFYETIIENMGTNPLGEVIWIQGQPIEIIGITAQPSGLFSINSVEIYLPWSTINSVYGQKNFNQLTLQVTNIDDMNQVGQTATRLLNSIHNTDDAYQVINIDEIAEGIGKITSIMTLIIGSIAGISLFVGGVGVMNIMLVSVTERTREIGLRKALGATNRQILVQFLIEAIVLTLTGGIVGVVIGVATSLIVSSIAGWPSLISWEIIIVGLLFSVIIGTVFGLLPARKAARLNPIDSLRYE